MNACFVKKQLSAEARVNGTRELAALVELHNALRTADGYNWHPLTGEQHARSKRRLQELTDDLFGREIP